MLALHEMQTALSKIWTRVAQSLSYNDNYYNMDVIIYGLQLDWIQFFYSWTSCHTKVKETSFPSYLFIVGNKPAEISMLNTSGTNL